MNASALIIQDLNYTCMPLSKCNLTEFSNITSSVNPSLHELSYDHLFIL